MLFPTTIVGSFPQPDWLIDREKLAGRVLGEATFSGTYTLNQRLIDAGI